MRTATFLVIAIAIFAILSSITLWHLLTVHPRRRKLVIATAAIGNLMWLFLPLLNFRNDFSRAVRATLGPPWFGWLCFVLIDAMFVALLAIAWLPFARRRRFRDFAHWPSRV